MQDAGDTWITRDFGSLPTSLLYAILRLRQAVFVVEQNCVYQDLDDLDQVADHLLLLRGGEVMAYQRCLPPGSSFTQSSIGRIIVEPRARREGLGTELVQRGIAHNRARWPDSGICIGAQAHLQRFYGALGFRVIGDVYLEDGIEHVHMLLEAPR
jgi:ElaA protein